MPRYIPFFNPKLIVNRADFTSDLEKSIFWGGPRSDVSEFAHVIKQELGYQIRGIKGPKWLDYLNCKIYGPSGCGPWGEEIFTGQKNRIEFRSMESLHLTYIKDDLRHISWLILNGEKVEGFELF